MRLVNASTIGCSILSKPCSRNNAASAASSSAARTLRLRERRSSSSGGMSTPRLGSSLPSSSWGGTPAELVAELELACNDCAALTRNDVRADLCEAPLGELGVALIELACHRELEN